MRATASGSKLGSAAAVRQRKERQQQHALAVTEAQASTDINEVGEGAAWLRKERQQQQHALAGIVAQTSMAMQGAGGPGGPFLSIAVHAWVIYVVP